ncbi:GNAT family acetyltransferase [Pseudomonas syringae]|uniref:GNAT family acetyltransferase n=1 Tax=Pseudomonas syringae TaxID=317 RepID=A0A1C7YZ64_PSESX|nr:GNAT family N-acetyltransferase [Pseudomonas syringae]OCR23074.1 GNAT family acetyltransferase [Pseudomonas syringae]
MPDIECSILPPDCLPLLDKFYREHRSSMRASSSAQAWIAKQQEILGALSLTPVAGGHWLTGLFVAPQSRSQGIASQLMDHALRPLTEPVWLFCHPDLQGFYEDSGFNPAGALPQSLGEKLMRYGRNKTLVALVRDGD